MATQYKQCKDCPKMFLAFTTDGPMRERCEPCRQKRIRKQTRERVRKLREKRIKVTKKNKRFIVHLQRPGSKMTYCGTKQDAALVARILYGSEPCDHRYCYTCAAMFQKATGAHISA